MKKKLQSLASKIVFFYCKKSNRTTRIEKELSFLKPGVSGKKLFYQYYQDKIVQLLRIAIVGGILIAVIGIRSISQNNELKQITRNEAGYGDKKVSFQAELEGVENDKLQLDVTVKERMLNASEARLMMKELKDKLPQFILGENDFLMHITKPLVLQNKITGYPITIRWESSQYDLIEDSGKLGSRSAGKEGETVTLHASLVYQNMKEDQFITVKVFPKEMTEEEKLRNNMLQKIEMLLKENSNSIQIPLPETENGQPIHWKEKKTSFVLLFTIFLILSEAAVFWGKDNDIHKQFEQRNNSLLLEYPDFVSTLQLLTSSGMTVKKAFQKIGTDYQKQRRDGGVKKYAYEEIILTNRKMEGGLSEREGYDFFGKRCGLICYRRLSALLIQNLNKGAEGLADALINETKNAFEERKQKAKKLGEEAGTKLLFPMMLMLIVVMIIIMIPAFFSFGGI